MLAAFAKQTEILEGSTAAPRIRDSERERIKSKGIVVMDHQPLKLEPIRNEKVRLSTFKKRKSSLLKKAHEFTTLCDVDACMIIYGPKVENLSVKPETWPSEEGKLSSIIGKYKKAISSADDDQRRTTLSRSGKNKMPQAEKDATRPRKKKCVANYTTWDERIDGFTEDRLKIILGKMENKLKAVDEKLNVIKRGQNAIRKAASGKLDRDSHSNAGTHKKDDAKSLNLELAIGLQPNDPSGKGE